MNRLFIHLYLDEDVSTLIAKLIEARHFRATTARDAGQLGKTDSEQLAYGAEHDMAILTHNRDDFGSLAEAYRASGRKHSGIIIAVRRSPYEIARRLLVILNQISAEEMENQIRYI